MEKKTKIILWSVYGVVQAALLAALVLLIIGLLPSKWTFMDNISTSSFNEETGGLNFARVKYFAPNNGEEHDGDSMKSTDKSINEYVIAWELVRAFTDYIGVHGHDTKIELEKLSLSHNDFCYAISGAENGDVWEVWVSAPKGGTPYVTVYKGGEQK